MRMTLYVMLRYVMALTHLVGQGAQRVTILNPSISLWNETNADNDRPQNKNLVENIEYLPPIKYSWFPFIDRREVGNVSVNQRLGGHISFPIGSQNTNLVEDVEILIREKFH